MDEDRDAAMVEVQLVTIDSPPATPGSNAIVPADMVVPMEVSPIDVPPAASGSNAIIPAPTDLPPSQPWPSSFSHSPPRTCFSIANPAPDSIVPATMSVTMESELSNSPAAAAGSETLAPVDMNSLMTRAVHQGLQSVLEKLETMHQHVVDLGSTCNERRDAQEDAHDADDEGEGDANPKAQYKYAGSKRAVEKSLHKFLRSDLVQLPFSPSVVDLPDSTEVAAYSEGETNIGPSIPGAKFLWNHTLQHKWNADLIAIICNAFIVHTQSDIGSESHGQHLNYPFVEHALIVTLNRIAHSYRRQTSTFVAQDSARRKRRLVRRVKSHERRMDTLRALILKGKNLTYWTDILTVVAMLGEDGMSSEETDWPGDSERPRTTMHVEKPWLNAPVSALLKQIDGAGSSKTAPTDGPRSGDENPNSHTMQAVEGLPVNFYCPRWYRGLSIKQKKRLGAKSPMSFSHLPKF